VGASRLLIAFLQPEPCCRSSDAFDPHTSLAPGGLEACTCALHDQLSLHLGMGSSPRGRYLEDPQEYLQRIRHAIGRQATNNLRKPEDNPAVLYSRTCDDRACPVVLPKVSIFEQEFSVQHVDPQSSLSAECDRLSERVPGPGWEVQQT
jgi:hypothetical protein